MKLGQVFVKFFFCFKKNVRGLQVLLGSLSMQRFRTRTATGSVLFSYLTCLHTTIFLLSSLFSLVETFSLKIWERPLSWRPKCSLPVAVRGSKTCMLKLPIRELKHATFLSHGRTPEVNISHARTVVSLRFSN